MKRIITLCTFALALAMTTFAQTDKMIGKWKTIDDDGTTAKSIVSIYKSTNGKFYGRVEKLFSDPNKKCTECEGANKNQPIVGLVVINGMNAQDKKLTGGTILDPKNGKTYYCNITLDESNPDKLNVKGSLDKKGWIGRSQTWIRVK